ncbi:SulP family inorganic anion transporter [Chengkuizengella axinellae]|uniref:Solute carrier family 26 protein n=1 Tax=Chengkuizengella axinellae TaxID=3064388 RepID=A0ABT9J4W3_9BACL|nr:solute carrier family 26 protein [Chengkuizengella sp. 2205SS18-9]MDP5276671.1 solute carrier family 26 protein [Chengkuizengella sp. 2205SS18-9]
MLKKIFPALDWIQRYNKQDLRGDTSAGLIVAIMLIPQAMAYAMIAGLPPVIGLYASTIPLFIYAIMGSSRQLAVGPVAMVSLLVFSGVSVLADPGTEEYLSYVFLLMFMTGIIQLAMGVFKLGFIVNFLSHAVVSGFTSAAALIIGMSQLKNLLGIDMESGETIFHTLFEAGSRINEMNLITFFIGIGSILFLWLFKKKYPRFPAPLIVVLVSTLLVYFYKLNDVGVKIVGEVPIGIPSFSLPAFDMDSIITLMPIALTISFVGFMESIAVAKAIASKENYKINSNQELNGLGLANVVGSFFSAYPVTGGFSRSAVNYQAGARTGLASIITAVLIVITLLFFTPLFYYLPNAVLAAIIMVAVFGLIDVKEFKHLFKVKKMDGWTLILTFFTTLILGIEEGIIIGAVFSLLVFIWRSAYPHIAELGYLKEKGLFRNIRRYPEAKTFENTLIFRIDASIYFANMGFIEKRFSDELLKKPSINRIILDFSAVNDIDAVSIDELEKIIDNYKNAGIEFIITGMKGPIKDLVKRAGWNEKYGQNIQYASIKHILNIG